MACGLSHSHDVVTTIATMSQYLRTKAKINAMTKLHTNDIPHTLLNVNSKRLLHQNKSFVRVTARSCSGTLGLVLWVMEAVSVGAGGGSV